MKYQEFHVWKRVTEYINFKELNLGKLIASNLCKSVYIYVCVQLVVLFVKGAGEMLHQDSTGQVFLLKVGWAVVLFFFLTSAVLLK